MSTPTVDAMIWGSAEDCTITPTVGDPGLGMVPASVVELSPGLGTIPDGTELYDPGLGIVGDCWGTVNLCTNCRPYVMFDDSWTGLQSFLGDTVYRPELAPWYAIGVPQSGEFGGIWVTDIKGFDSVPMTRGVIELVGAGAAAGPQRDTSRILQFTALLFACTNAGLEFGRHWLDCQLRKTNDTSVSVLRYLSAHPDGTAADPSTLVRESHGVVLTKPLAIQTQSAGGSSRHPTMYTVTWEMAVLHPYQYAPPVSIPVIWDRIESQPIEWVHDADCDIPDTCDPMPQLFNDDCVPETIDIVATPPPTCGGCLPVCAIQTSVFILDGPQPPILSGSPGVDVSYPSACHSTAISWSIANNGTQPLTAQTYWRPCAADIACGDMAWPTQITGLPSGAVLTFDAIGRRYWVNFESHPNRDYRPVGMVSTPTGSPWEPAVLDRSICWEWVVQAADGADFEVTLRLYDREV